MEATIESKERESIGKFLYRFAWAVEIIAVLIGLSIAVMTVYAGAEELQRLRGGERSFGDYTNLTISALPFLMVALVELTKIPFAGAFYKTKSIVWKSAFFVMLIFLSVITFESAMNGFERNFSSMTSAIDSDRKELAFTDEQILIIDDRIVEAEELTADVIESDFNSRREQLRSDRDEATQNIKREIDTLRGSIETSYINGLKEERKMYQDELALTQRERLDAIRAENSRYESREATLNKDIDSRRRELNAQLNQAEKALRATEGNARDALAKANIFSRGGIEDKADKSIAQAKEDRDKAMQRLEALDGVGERDKAYEKQRSSLSAVEESYRSEINEIRTTITQRSIEISTAITTEEADIEELLSNRTKDMRDVETKFEKQLAENSSERARKFEMLHSNEETIAGLHVSLDTRRAERAQLRDNINQKVGNNQVYRIAQQWYGNESAADLSRDQVGMVALLWFGSLAALAAFTGVMLALASYVIRDKERFSREQSVRKQGRGFINSLRRTVIFMYKRSKKPVIEYVDREVPREVIREVPVEKVVKVETPVQVVRTRIVHVPLYTNDSELLNQKADQQLEEELNHVELQEEKRASA